MKRFLLLLGTLALAGCLDTTAPTPSDPSTEQFASTLGVDLTKMQRTSNGTYYQDLSVGSGTAITTPAVGDSVFVDYTGWLTNGTMFDTNTGVGFPLGGVIIGFVDGMIGMQPGGTRLIVIPSDLGYGNTTQTTRYTTIQPNSTLVFKIKLNSYKPVP
jgi:FKBP-type peptidyl-prolyl cis-trans isomerase